MPKNNFSAENLKIGSVKVGTSLEAASTQHSVGPGAQKASRTFDLNKPIFVLNEQSEFVMHHLEAMVIHQPPIFDNRKTDRALALISFNQRGLYRTPVLRGLFKIKLLGGDVSVQRLNGNSLVFDDDKTIVFNESTSEAFRVMVSGSGFAQILAEGAILDLSASGPVTEGDGPSSSFPEPVVDN